MIRFNENVAMLTGTNAAVVAELLKFLIDREAVEIQREYGKVWCRCSMKMVTVFCPFLTVWQVKKAINILMDKGLISKHNFNSKSFDHTNWYAFTEYGRRIMWTG